MTTEDTSPASPANGSSPDSPPNRIKEWRNRRRMSLAELGEIVGLSRSEISKLENGARRVRTDHLTALAKALRVKPEELISTEAARIFAGATEDGATGTMSTLPILVATEENGFITLSDDPCDQTRCPPRLVNVPRAYAFLMPSTSMEPRIPVGAMLYVHPYQPARPGDLAVARLQSGSARLVGVERGAAGLIGQGPGDTPPTSLADPTVLAVERVVGLWFP